MGWDEDVDDTARAAVEERSGGKILDKDAQEGIDVVLLWWREGDGDLENDLVDAISPLVDNEMIWLLTPTAPQQGSVSPSEIAEAAAIVGLSSTKAVNVSENWSGTRLMSAKPSAQPKR